MKSWFEKLPIVSTIVGVLLGLKNLAEKQIDTADRMEDTRATTDEIIDIWDPKIPDPPPEIPKKLEPVKPPKVVPAPALVTRNTVIQHSMRGCAPCAVDKRVILPKWRTRGYNVLEIDEGNGIPGSRYPWYEVFDKDGNQRIHVGSLPNPAP